MEAAGVEVLLYKGDDLAEGRRRSDLPDAADAPVNLFEAIAAGDEDALREEPSATRERR